MNKIKNILLATKSMGKIKELEHTLGEIFNIITLRDLRDQDKVIEDGKSYYENAYKKAMYYFQKYNIPTLAEDSGIEVKALDGQPGIYSHRFAGDGATDKDNNIKLLTSLKNIKDLKKREAIYKACCVLIFENQISETGEREFISNKRQLLTIDAQGECKGYIYFKEVGKNGFGYDPIFYYPTFGKTFAQVSLEEKSKVSHRANAIKNLIAKLIKYKLY